MTAKNKKEKQSPAVMRFFISKIFWLNIAAFIIFLCITLWLTFFFIKQYSRHNDSKTVPYLIGMPSGKAKELSENSDLAFTIIDSIYDPDRKPLSVTNQDPLPDMKVKSGRKIYVTINMANPPATEIPFIEAGTSFVSVREILQTRGLKVDDVTYRPFEYRDVFLDMKLHGKSASLIAGEKIPKGSKIDVVLGNGLGNSQIDIPDLRTFTYTEAVNLLQLKELNLGTVITSGTITDTANAFVYKQSPSWETGKQINLGSMIDIWISQEEIIPENR